MKHHYTPGPWEVATQEFDNEGFPETVIQALCGSAVVAVAIDFGGNNPGMRERNARLIAATTDLLEALEAVDNGYRCGHDLSLVINEVRAAIEKAIGDQHAH